jgi:hypothetical protein
MKTTNVILVGVLGVSAVGAYMFFTRKQRKTAMLQQKGLEIVNIGSTTQTTPSSTTTSGGSTIPTLATQSDGVSPSDANINLTNATFLVAEIKAIDKEYSTPFNGNKLVVGDPNWRNTKEYDAYLQMQRTYKIRREPKITALAKLGYKLDATGTLIRI